LSIFTAVVAAGVVVADPPAVVVFSLEEFPCPCPP